MPIAIRPRDAVMAALAPALGLALAAPALAQAAATPADAPASPASMTARDLVTLPRLGAVVTNAPGTLAIYAVTTTDPATLARSTAHHLIDLTRPSAPAVPLDLTLPAEALAFGPQGQLFVLSRAHPDPAAEARGRVWRVSLAADGTTGAPQLVADYPGTDLAGFSLAPTGRAIALWANLPRACASLACPEAAPSPRQGSGRSYDAAQGFVRHWDRFATPGTPSRVFVVSLEGGVAGGGGVPVDGRDPATGITGNTPTLPFGGAEDIAWAPDGQSLYFVAREAGADEPQSTDTDIYVSDLTGAPPRVLTGANPATDTLPAPSPDGRRLAWLAMARPGYESDRLAINLLDLATGRIRVLTDKSDLSFGSLTWSADGRALLATAQSQLDTPAYRIDPETGAVSELNLIAGNEAHIAGLIALPGDRLLFTRDSIGQPAELYLAEGSEKGRPLTDIVTTRMGAMAATITQRFSFAGADGDTVWGQITRPAAATGPLPALLFVHGGPQGTYNDAWSNRWNPRVFAAQGYAVIAIDFHGSTGYGQDFTDAIRKDWGGKPLEDLQKGLAAALARDRQIDGTRACALGPSYGGYMINWIAGRWPKRFRCLVQHAGIFDTRSFYYSTEERWFPRWDFGGSYEEARETYERWNPANHVAEWRTPMLVTAGMRDYRVPYTQPLQSFTALQERGIPAELLLFPDENHWILGAANSLQWHETVFRWLDRWLRPAAPAPAASPPLKGRRR